VRDDTDLIKHRDIGFQGPQAEREPAEQALLLLSDVEGMEQVSLLEGQRIGVSYDLRRLSYVELESALIEVGFHIDQNLLYKLKRALWTYTEATQRANLGLEAPGCVGQCAEKVFVRHYRSRSHGCRDARPRHWRRYL
jgi:hypothetical protein